VRTPLLALLLVLGACSFSSPPARFYSLEPLAARDAPVAQVAHLAIGPISLPDGLDRSQMVTRLGPYELHVDDFARWAEPLDDAVARVLGSNLGALLDAQLLTRVPADGGPGDALRVSVQVLKFEADATHSLLEARWQVWNGKPGGPVTARKSTCVAERHGEDAESVAAAMSENLAQLAREVAGVVKGGG
jgi:uncharacterized lipoprotein YmbA